MFKKFVLIVLVLIGLLLAFAWTRPDTYHVQRTGHVAAPPQQVFDLVGDFRHWPEWSPWEDLDPQMQRVYSSPSQGVGASYDWSGNEEAGKGRMQIRQARAPQRLDIDLQFIEPMASSNRMRFDFTPAGDGTEVLWQMEGQHSFATKIMSVFMSFDRLIGRDFDKGLANLARLARTPAAGTPVPQDAGDTAGAEASPAQ